MKAWGLSIVSGTLIAGSLASCSPSFYTERFIITGFLPSEGSYVGGTFSASVMVTGESVTDVTLAANGNNLGLMTRDTRIADRYWALVPSRLYPDGPLTMTVSARNGADEKASAGYGIIIDNTPPRISLPYLPSGGTFSDQIPLLAEATDNLAVDKVVFSINGISVGEVRAPPYFMILFTTDLLNGPQAISARTFDKAGNFSTTTQVVIALQR